MQVMIFDTLEDAETALAVLAALGEAALGPGGDGHPIVDQGGQRVLIGRKGHAGAFDYDSPGTSLRWGTPRQVPTTGKWWLKSLNEKPRFNGTDWRDQYLAAGGPAFRFSTLAISWFDADGNLKPYAGA